MRDNALISTLVSFAYTRIRPALYAGQPVLYSSRTDGIQSVIAVICDDMTWYNFKTIPNSVSITPGNWRQIFSNANLFKINMLFCEAAWSGVRNSCWRGQIYKDKRVLFENRRKLLQIINICKSENIPTVFWAKEDPAYFQDGIYNFTDTALNFDYILTTADECIPRYRMLGARNVYLWPFGFSPEYFYPPENDGAPRERAAVFAGSWFAEFPRRCNDTAAVFDMVIQSGISLKIYDRNRKSGYSGKPFPEKYQPYVKDSVSYDKLGDIYRKNEYVININTINDSNTMFARRVYEAMACGCVIISNESEGMRRQFHDTVWYSGGGFDFSLSDEIRRKNIETVFNYHTWERRIEQLWSILNLPQQ